MRLLLMLLLLTLPENKGKHDTQINNTSRSTHQDHQETAAVPPVVQRFSLPQAPPETKIDKTSATPKPDPFMSHAEWIMAILTAIYVLLTGVYVNYSAKTLRALQRQTELIESGKELSDKAASAALLNAQAVINAERALILFNVSKDAEKDIYVVKAINYGRVPARQIEISEKRQILTSIDQLIAKPPDYGDRIESIQEYLAPSESWPVAYIVGQRTPLERYYDKSSPIPTADFITYGQVTYLDGMSPDIRHSRYCIALDVNDRYEPISVVGSEEYLECT